VDHGLGVEPPQLGQRGAAVEQPGIEEVGAGAPGLEGELAETQNTALDGKTNEVALIRLHEEIRSWPVANARHDTPAPRPPHLQAPAALRRQAVIRFAPSCRPAHEAGFL